MTNSKLVVKKKLLILILPFTILACKNTGNDYLTREQMVSVIIDLEIAESVANSKSDIKPDSARNLYFQFEREILKKHKITKEEYSKSYKYYMTDISQMDEIYEDVVDSISLREARGKIE